MSRRMRRGGIIMMVLFCLLVSAHVLLGYVITPPSWQLELCKGLNTLKSGNFLDPGKNDLHTMALSAQESETAIQAIFEILMKRTGSLESYWRTSENRAVRSFILALFYCIDDPASEFFPLFELYIQRFNNQERQERAEELDFVFKYRAALSRELRKILEKRVPYKYQEEFENALGQRGRLWFLKPLFPCWCHGKSL
jgi:hypothetical protein